MKNAKLNEIQYPDRLDLQGRLWLKTKPFGSRNLKESERIFRDLGVILFIISQYSQKPKKIIELGCGPGWLSVFLAKFNFKVLGLDISPKMIEIARARAQTEKVSARFKVLDIEQQIVKSEINRNDIVIIYDSLHHCPHEKKVIKKACKYLKKGGILILGEPNKFHEYSPRSKAAVLKYGVLERGFKVKELAHVCHKIGFRKVWRLHGSDHGFTPRSENLKDTLKMIFYPFLARFFLGKFMTRIWLVAKK